MVTKEEVRDDVTRRFNRAQMKLKALTQDEGYKERAYRQMESIGDMYGMEMDAEREYEPRLWKLKCETGAIPDFDSENERTHLLGAIYAALWENGGMYNYEIAHELRKPVFLVNHGLKVLANAALGCPLEVEDGCVKLDGKIYVGYAQFDSSLFGQCREAAGRYANWKNKPSGVSAETKADKIMFVLADGKELLFDKMARKFSYNGKPVAPPKVNDLFSKSWREWREKHKK